MKRLFAIIFALACVSAAYAQNDAETLWDSLRQQGQLSMDFTLRGIDTNGVVVTSEQGVAYLNGDSYRIECGDMLVCCDGTSMWMYNSESEELVIDHDAALPFMQATNVKRDQTGTIYATYYADDVTFNVKITNLANPSESFAQGFFTIDTSSLSDNVIVTDLRD